MSSLGLLRNWVWFLGGRIEAGVLLKAKLSVAGLVTAVNLDELGLAVVGGFTAVLYRELNLLFL